MGERPGQRRRAFLLSAACRCGASRGKLHEPQWSGWSVREEQRSTERGGERHAQQRGHWGFRAAELSADPTGCQLHLQQRTDWGHHRDGLSSGAAWQRHLRQWRPWRQLSR
ncbi:hypothetical protein AGOR_G00192550 [Albula goreensis]|uniref:Uncharacterized protein n=1 Tax=Albula goreensis TaxID=1534307 RepID=A0A8T3CYE9_9TELE|nr:hypothetical protein AGOR_G00192550 [Albula goreensis]